MAARNHLVAFHLWHYQVTRNKYTRLEWYTRRFEPQKLEVNTQGSNIVYLVFFFRNLLYIFFWQGRSTQEVVFWGGNLTFFHSNKTSFDSSTRPASTSPRSLRRFGFFQQIRVIFWIFGAILKSCLWFLRFFLCFFFYILKYKNKYLQKLWPY